LPRLDGLGNWCHGIPAWNGRHHPLDSLGRDHISRMGCNSSNPSWQQLPLRCRLHKFDGKKSTFAHHFSPWLEKVKRLTGLSAQVQGFLFKAPWREMGAFLTPGAFAAIRV
jgi:hypothetical protein